MLHVLTVVQMTALKFHGRMSPMSSSSRKLLSEGHVVFPALSSPPVSPPTRTRSCPVSSRVPSGPSTSSCSKDLAMVFTRLRTCSTRVVTLKI